MIPHWDFGRGWRNKSKIIFLSEAVLDTLVGLFVTFLIFGSFVDIWYLLACIIASLLFDIAQLPYWFFNWHFPPFSWAYKVQSKMQGRAKTVLGGIMTQVATVGVVIFLLQFVPKV